MIFKEKPLYVYLQRPDNGEWITVGRYSLDKETHIGTFLYAPTYIDAGFNWSIDPVNLPFIPKHPYPAHRYNGLHDILRDASPDAWGKLLLQKEHDLPPATPDLRYLTLAGNADRWGALAVGSSKLPSIARMAFPGLPQLETLSNELLAIAERKPPVDAKLRKRLFGTPSMGGARPKASVRHGDEFWLAKPFLPTDTADIPLLEHAAHEWAAHAGLRFAKTCLHRLNGEQSVVRVLRFDRKGDRRLMTISGASLLSTEYPGANPDEHARWSYPRLAEELHRIGAPDEDLKELFGRMIFNAVVGNDDDHPRNHAAVYRQEEARWRLSPAFDVVPNPDETPKRLTLQVSAGNRMIDRTAMLADAVRFGFRNRDEAALHLDRLLTAIRDSFDHVSAMLTDELKRMLSKRLAENLRLLSNTAG
ncbi:HipA domain-containing protein [Oxalobacteraceae bacterium CAVE-383]|nr:HipA domain-containing protein [Oxalobacteraceae bacterium CAVE-383]